MDSIVRSAAGTQVGNGHATNPWTFRDVHRCVTVKDGNTFFHTVPSLLSVIWSACGNYVLTAAAVTLLCACTAYVPGRKSYWDEQVSQMCQKDGGVTVYETVFLNEDEYRRLGGTSHGLPIPASENDRPSYPYIREQTLTRIREANPEVVRTEEVIKRRADQKVLARSVRYSRRGGDIPTGIAHHTSFTCPADIQLSTHVFKIKGQDK
jgi:hypothetical protein